MYMYTYTALFHYVYINIYIEKREGMRDCAVTLRKRIRLPSVFATRKTAFSATIFPTRDEKRN